MKYLVIVESPNKKDKISSYLNTISGHTFTVEASYGHIRYFEDGLKSIDIKNNFKPTYAVLDTKKKVVSNLKTLMKKVDEVLIATDQDREGEAIGFHIAYTLGLDPLKTKRISFNEITKNAIISAYNSPKEMDLNLFNAQQARSELDLLIGFEISPVLWKYIKPGLSAGRCQSPGLRLIYEREKEIEDFKSNKYFNLNGSFALSHNLTANASYMKKLESKEEAVKLLEELIEKEYELIFKDKKTSNSTPPAPFITSSIQQEASNRFGMSPKSTMSSLQTLYEKGKITYLRTDSTSISDGYVDEVKTYLDENYPNTFEKRTYNNKVANAQEAHECIRPVSVDTVLDDNFSQYDKKVFDLIKKRSIASQMMKYKEMVYNYELKNKEHIFSFSLKKIIDLGWKAIYEECVIDEEGNPTGNCDQSALIKEIEKKSGNYKPDRLIANEIATKPKSRYTEASLIKELEDKGIGRPSTFSNIVSTLLERGYVIKKTKDGNNKIQLEELTKESKKEIKLKTKEVNASVEKNKLMVTDVGRLVCNFMNENFENINSYDFTSEVETDLDKISRGEKIWYNIVNKVYTSFHPKVVELNKNIKELKSENKPNNVSKRLLGVNPKTKLNVYAYLGKYGPCIQEGESDSEPRYVSLTEEDTLEEIDLERALELLSYPKLLGKIENVNVYIKKGKYGLYLEKDKIRKSIDSDVTLDEAKNLLKEATNNVIKEFATLSVINGPYGPYIKKGKENFKIPEGYDAEKLTNKECLEIIKANKDKPKKPFFKKFEKK